MTEQIAGSRQLCARDAKGWNGGERTQVWNECDRRRWVGEDRGVESASSEVGWVTEEVKRSEVKRA